MATADYIISNQSGASFRTDLNNTLAAIVSNNSNSSSPSTTYAYQWWADTSAGALKIRNSANNAWIELLQLDGTLTLEDGTNSAPALAFRGDLDTGIYSSASNTFNVATAGVERMELGSATIFNEGGEDVDFRIEGDTEANLFYLDAGNNRVGIGLSAPTSLLHVKDASGSADAVLTIESESGSDAFLLLDTSNGSGANADVRFAVDGTTKGRIAFVNSGSTAGDMFFAVNDNTERMRIAADGDIGIGLSSSIGSRVHAVDGNQRNGPHYIFEATASTGTNNDGDVFMIRSARGTGNVNPILHVLTSTSSTVLSVTGDSRVSIQGAPTTSNFGAKFQVRESGQAATTLTALFGANENASGTTGGISDNTNKACRIGLPHYDTDQKAAAMFVGYAGNGVNELYLGGGTGIMNAATSVRVYADSSSSVNNGGNQIARFDSDGLKFNSDTAAANGLSDYEEGTWTPAVNQGIDGGAAYQIQRGHYVKVGQFVHATFFLRFVNSATGSTGNGNAFRLQGLPFNTLNTSPSYSGGGLITYTSVNFNSTSNQKRIWVGSNSSVMEIYHSNNSATSIGGNVSNNGADIYGFVNYRSN